MLLLGALLLSADLGYIEAQFKLLEHGWPRYLLLLAVDMGLGTHLRSGAVMDDPRTREAMGVPEGERIVAMVQLGEPAVVPDAKPRKTLDDVTTWLP